MKSFLPPDTTKLIPAVVERNSSRARRLVTALRPFASTKERSEAVAALEATLASLREPRRTSFLFGPEARAWLCLAEEALALARPPAGAGDLDLFERVSGGPHLRELLPHGVLDRGFRRRAKALGGRLLERAFRHLPVLVAGLTPRGRTFGPFTLDLSPDGEEARARGEIHFAFPALLTLSVPAGRATLMLRDGSIQPYGGPPGARCLPREILPGSGIVLARRAISTRNGLRPGPRVRDLSTRFAEALDLVGAAWEEGWREILAQTRVVVPLVEKNTVSFSLPDRPGTSYINVSGKSLVDLADDLLHETAHHRLHGHEEIAGPLDRDDGEPRYFSPWRRSVRPVHGILHAAYTFAWRAELLKRLLDLPAAGRGSRPRVPRAWIRREIGREIAMLRRSLADLEDAASRGLLTSAGRVVSRRIGARFREIEA